MSWWGRGSLLPVAFLALGLGLVGGWFLGGSGTAERDAVPRLRSKSDRGSHRRAEARVLPEETRAVMRRATEGGTKNDRIRAAMELANSIPVDQIERCLDEFWFDSVEGRVEMVYHDILYARFFEADPERFMARCLRKEIDRIGELYMTLWTERDPAAAEAFVGSLTDASELQRVGDFFLAELAKTNPGAALERLGEWGRQHAESSWLVDALQPIAKSNRESLLEASASWPLSLRDRARVQVGISWLSEDFRGGLAWLRTQQDGERLFAEAMDDYSGVAKELRNHLADLPEGWLDQAIASASHDLVREDPMGWLAMDREMLGASEESVMRLRTAAINRLASMPERREDALTLVALGTGLESALRENLVGGLIRTWDRNDRAGAEAWLASLGSEELVTAGLQQWERTESSRTEFGPIRPGELMAQLGGGGTGRFQNYYEIRTWTAAQVAEARAAFGELPAAGRDEAALGIVMEGRSYVAPGIMADALGHLLKSAPADEAGGAAMDRERVLNQLVGTAYRWGAADPRAAAEWVESLPEGEATALAARNVYEGWSRFAPAEAQGWLERMGMEVPEP